MTTKNDVLQYIRSLAESKAVTKEELIEAYDSGKTSVRSDAVLTKKIGTADILYFVGAAVIVTGIVIMLWQNWEYMSFAFKLGLTLGAGILTFLAGLYLSRKEHTESMGTAFYFISAITTPIGLWVIIKEANSGISLYGSHTLISAIMLAIYLIAFSLTKKNFFTLFSIFYGTWFFFSLTSLMVANNTIFSIVSNSIIFEGDKYYMYRALGIGLAYSLIAYSFSQNERSPLSGLLYGMGIIAVLGSAFALGGFKPYQNIYWEIIFPFMIFGSLILSVNIKSMPFLTWGTFFLMAFIIKMTIEYFAKNLDWSIALMGAGLAIIGVGYLAFLLKKKYLPNS